MNPIVTALMDAIAQDDRALDQLAAVLAPRIKPQAPSPYLNADEAAGYLRCSKQRIYDLTSSGRLRPLKDGARNLYSRTEMDRYLAGGHVTK